jgi:hypothetical protein
MRAYIVPPGERKSLRGSMSTTAVFAAAILVALVMEGASVVKLAVPAASPMP